MLTDTNHYNATTFNVQVLRDILKEVQSGMVPRTMLTEWAVTAFPDATHYWTFRKMVTVQLGVLGLMEYVLHLTRLFPDMLYLHQDSGLINVAYFKFNMDDSKGLLTASFINLLMKFRKLTCS